MSQGRDEATRHPFPPQVRRSIEGRWHWRLPYLLLVAALVPMAASAGSTVCVIRSSLHPDYGNAIDGIRRSVHSPLAVKTLTGVPEADTEIVRKAVAAKPRFIVALGAPAARLTKAAHGKVPFLVGLVQDGEKYAAAGGMTGQPSPTDEIDTLLAFRRKVKTLGIFYDPETSHSVALKVAGAARDHGLSPIDGPVRTPADAPKVFRRLTGTADAILLIPGRSVVASGEAMSFMVLESIARGVILYTRSGYLVKRGALFQLAIDPGRIGAQLGRMLSDLLLGKKELPKVGFVSPHHYQLTINTRTARILSLRIPDAYRKASAVDGLLTVPLGSAEKPATFSPARVIASLSPRWPKEADPSVSDAIVVFQLDIGRSGKVTDHRLLQGAGPFVREATSALDSYRIAPATLGERPVPSKLIVTVRFQRPHR